MKRNMAAWTRALREEPVKRALPILSFPAVQLLGVSVRDLILDSCLQAQGMLEVARRTPRAGGSVSLMDLSVEAECFGAPIRLSDDEVPAVVGPVLESQWEEDERMERARALAVPQVGAGRTGLCIEAIERAAAQLEDRPVFAGVIGPFSLAGRLLDVTQTMLYCYDEPEMVHVVLGKATAFLIAYIQAYKDAGANGVVIAEPLAGLLSPALAQSFSGDYCKQIVSACKAEHFAVIYHNCGNTARVTLDSIFSCGADAYHFGNAVDMAEILSKAPADVPCLGNIDPVSQFRNGTPESMRRTVLRLLETCGGYPNFVISSGCDIPPLSRWENIDAFFEVVNGFYENRA